jgi:hypothetical protein
MAHVSVDKLTYMHEQQQKQQHVRAVSLHTSRWQQIFGDHFPENPWPTIESAAIDCVVGIIPAYQSSFVAVAAGPNFVACSPAQNSKIAAAPGCGDIPPTHCSSISRCCGQSDSAQGRTTAAAPKCPEILPAYISSLTAAALYTTVQAIFQISQQAAVQSAV